jgi:magnesium transporter
MPDNFDSDLLVRLLEQKKFSALRGVMDVLNPVDVAEWIETLNTKDMAVVFRTMSKEATAEIFANLEPETQQVVISFITDQELAAIVDELFVDDAVDMLEELPANMVTRVLRSAKPETRKLINQFLKYPEDSTGSIMTAEFIDLRKDMTVEQAFARIRQIGADSELIYTCYVIDSQRFLQGVVSVRELLLASYETVIGDIMSTELITATTLDDQESTAQAIQKYDLIAMPVVDQEGRLVGIVTVDDVMDVIEEETSEDIAKMAAIAPSEKSYMKSTPFDLWKARIPWLMLLTISATFTGMIITKFEDALSASLVLTAFIPMLMDSGGNCGSQASVTVIRAISLDEISFSDLGTVIWKEFRTAILCGVCLAAVSFLKLQLIDRLLLGNDAVTLSVSLVVALTLMCTVLCAKLVGCILPMLAKKLGFDPAVMSSPFITTIVDAISLIIYFQIAQQILHI